MLARSGIGLACVFAALIGASPAAAQKKPPPQVKFNGGFLYHQETLTAGVKSFTVTCPAGHVAVGGGVFLIGAQAKQLTSVPGPGPRKWTFGFGYAGAGQTTVIVLVTCIKPAATKVVLKFKTGKKTVLIGPGQTKTVRVRCPAGTAPVGSGGVAQVASGSKSKPRARAADVVPSQVLIETRVVPIRGGFDLTWHNPGMETFEVNAQARCMARKAKRKRRRRKPKTMTAEVVRRTSSETAKPGFNRFTESCGRGRVPVSAGWEFMPTGDLDLTHSLQRTGSADFSVQNAASSVQAMTLYLLCVRGRFSFQRDV